MERRQFIKIAGAAGIASSLAGGTFMNCGKEMQVQNIYRRLLDDNDNFVPDLLKKQELRPTQQWYGGVPNEYGIHSAGGTARFIQVLTCAYFASESRFHGQEDFVKLLELTAGYLLKAQHDDGTIDLATTNFHSTPDTGFVLEQVCTVFNVLKRDSASALENIKIKLQEFIIKAADALVVGGIHKK